MVGWGGGAWTFGWWLKNKLQLHFACAKKSPFPLNIYLPPPPSVHIQFFWIKTTFFMTLKMFASKSWKFLILPSWSEQMSTSPPRSKIFHLPNFPNLPPPTPVLNIRSITSNFMHNTIWNSHNTYHNCDIILISAQLEGNQHKKGVQGDLCL